jgi:hypothetical protein
MEMIHMTEAEIKREFKATRAEIADIKTKIDQLVASLDQTVGDANSSLKKIRARLDRLEGK